MRCVDIDLIFYFKVDLSLGHNIILTILENKDPYIYISITKKLLKFQDIATFASFSHAGNF